MATLLCTATGHEAWVPGHLLVGRSSTCGLRTDDPSVSSEHASIRWMRDRWELRDLGSRNGTFVDAHPVPSGGSVPMAAGQQLRLGPRWTLTVVDVDPPAVAAERDGERIESVLGLLSLPGDAAVYADADGHWVFDGAQGTWPVADGDTVTLDGSTWRLRVPSMVEGTWGAQSETLSLTGAQLHFRVSRDEEHVTLTLSHPAGSVDLGERMHHYLLLTLARLRMKDAAAEPERPGEHGWVETARLAKMLAVDGEHLRVMIHRARKQLAGAGVEGSAALVERRTGSRCVRIGTGAVDVVTT
jgi:pSer/pThr/pTyr-binding forkhead associated (FHA) protein